MSVIIDTCVWSQFLRRDRRNSNPLVTETTKLIQADDVVILGPIRQELLSGALTERYEQLREYLRFYPNLPLEEEDDELAARHYNSLRERGIQGTGTDLLICAAAVRRNLRIFTVNRDFEFYAKHIPIRLHRFRGDKKSGDP